MCKNLKSFLKIFIISIIIGVMGACGFKPLYRQTAQEDLLEKTSQIYITPVTVFDGARGVELRNILLNKLTPYGKPINPQYILEIALSQPEETAYTIKDDGTASSYLIKINASFILKRKDSKKVLAQNTVSADLSYNILKNQYSTEMLKSDAIRLAIENIANQIYFSVITYFSEN